MTPRTTPTTHPNASSVEATLLARLGLPAGASSQEVEAAYDAISEFLEGSPGELRGWARQQIEMIDEAFALLSDPTIDRSALAEGVVAEAPARAPVAARVAAMPAESAAPLAPVTGNRLMRRVAIGAAALVVVVVIAIAGFNLNGGTGVPSINGTPAPEAAAAPAVDPAQVSALMEKIQADPKDVASLQSLADLYYQAGDFSTAGTFLEKVLAVDSKNLTALLALGAVQFNQGNSTDAEKQWRAVLAVDANNVEAHYDLGFMYLSQDPPDVANVKIEWGKVMEIAPDSDVAKTVATHLASLESSPSPGASGAPVSAAPSTSAAPSSGPAASPAASAN